MITSIMKVIIQRTQEDPDDPNKPDEATEIFNESNISDVNIADTSIAGSTCEQQTGGKVTEAKSAYKRKISTQKSADNIVESFNKISDDRDNLLSTAHAKQPEEQHRIYTFFKSMTMFLKKMFPEN